MTYVDSHSHLADPRLDSCRAQVIASARQKGIQTFIQAGVDPEDWARQLELAKVIPGFIPVLGLHPYFVCEHLEEECEAALDQLSRLMGKPEVKAIGELGLDFRPSIEMKSGESSKARQVTVFEMQLEMAQMAHKPMVFHFVRAFDESIRSLALWSPFTAGGMVHSFNGSLHQAEEYMKFGFHISIGGAICREDNIRLHQVVAGISIEKLLLETDSPYQAPLAYQAEFLQGLNENSSLLMVAKKVADIKRTSVDEVLDITSKNAKKLFSL